MMAEVNTNKECVLELNKHKIICEKCQLSFANKGSFYRHKRRIHNEEINSDKGKVCGFCQKKLLTLTKLYAHIAEKHDVALQFTEETFYCEDDFLKWKSKIEVEGQSNFIMNQSRENTIEGVKVRCYACHRSGFSKERNKEGRIRSKPFSCKIGSTCPAAIKVVTETVEGISCIKVKYQSVHVGHELGVKLRLSPEDKARLASSLNAGVSISSLLKELNKNYAPSHPYRQVTRKDLHNLSKSFKLSRTSLLKRDDLVTMDIVVKKIFTSDLQSALLIYKPVGETLPEYPALNENDFLLGIMNDVQEKLLEIYGNACIMVDYTDCINMYLTTIMVRDEYDESLPVATFFSSKISVEILQPFFDGIQLRLPELKTKIIMSDDIIWFYNAWQKVFKDDAQHLLCSSFVLRNLIRNVEIKVKNENRKAVKNYLKSILKEEDISTFEFMMKTFIEEYKFEEKNFINYFQTNYENRTKKWAYCYRMALGINPDVKLERWRNKLKLDKRSTASKKLDKTVFLVYSITAKKLISNAIIMEREKLSVRISLSQKLHEESQSKEYKYNVVEMNENKCTISEIENGKTFHFTVERLRDNCGCDIRCDMCNVCIHSMSCSCVDYCIHFAICKHMHRFCGSLVPGSKIVTSQESDDSVTFCDDESSYPMELDDDLSPEPVTEPQFVIDNIRDSVKTQLQRLEKRVEDIKFLEVLKNVEENVKSINSYLDEAIPS